MKLSRLNNKSVNIYTEEDTAPQQPDFIKMSEQERLNLMGMIFGFFPDLRPHAAEFVKILTTVINNPNKIKLLANKKLTRESILYESLVSLKRKLYLSELITCIVYKIDPSDPTFLDRLKLMKEEFLPQISAAFSLKAGHKVNLDRSIDLGSFNMLNYMYDPASKKYVKVAANSRRGGRYGDSPFNLTNLLTFMKEAVELGSFLWGAFQRIAAGDPFSDIATFTEKYAEWKANPEGDFNENMNISPDEVTKISNEVKDKPAPDKTDTTKTDTQTKAPVPTSDIDDTPVTPVKKKTLKDKQAATVTTKIQNEPGVKIKTDTQTKAPKVPTSDIVNVEFDDDLNIKYTPYTPVKPEPTKEPDKIRVKSILNLAIAERHAAAKEAYNKYLEDGYPRDDNIELFDL